MIDVNCTLIGWLLLVAGELLRGALKTVVESNVPAANVFLYFFLSTILNSECDFNDYDNAPSSNMVLIIFGTMAQSTINCVI